LFLIQYTKLTDSKSDRQLTRDRDALMHNLSAILSFCIITISPHSHWPIFTIHCEMTDADKLMNLAAIL